MISRSPVVAYLPIAGQYRYRDILQLIPAKGDDPKPPFASGLFGGTLAVAFDDLVAPERPNDLWAHDHRERNRIAYLASKIDDKPETQEWLAAVKQSYKTFARRRATETEARRLLQTLTNSTLQQVSTSGHGWYLDPQSQTPIFGQKAAPSFCVEQYGEFWTGQSSSIPVVDATTHFQRYGIGPDDTQITIPSNLDENLDRYFALEPHRKIGFSRACQLFTTAQEIWLTSQSLSLVSNVFAIETLCHIDDPEPERCPECSNLISAQRCKACGGPRFGLTRRFSEFVNQFIEGEDEQKLARRLFAVRSEIAHRGELLRSDEYHPGFNLGGKDDQDDLERQTGRTVRKILLGWLSRN